MAPYPNRVVGGSFPWLGSTFDLRHPRDPETAIHGIFRYVSWEIAEKDAASITLTMDSTRAAREFNYPSSYQARLSYELKSKSLHVTVLLENTGKDPLPFGTGPHMYALRHALGSTGPTLTHQADTWYPPEAGSGVPSSTPEPLPEHRRYPTETNWSLDWDHCLSNWGDCTRISWPDVALAVEVRDRAQNCPYLQVWNTKDQEICAVEPQTMVPAKLGDTEECLGLGCQILAPGESTTAHWEFAFSF
jgi:galactose mutarotase-like enzyme